MADYQWAASSGGSWNTATNWNPPGGPQGRATPFGRNSADTAEFATGSQTAYSVSGNGDGASIAVTHDLVTFAGFAFNNSSGSALTVTGGAQVTIADGSTVFLVQHNGAPAGSIVVEGGSILIISGSVSAAGMQVTGGSHVALSGAGASLKLNGAVTLDATSSLSVIEGATFTTAAAGLLGSVVVGNGSTLELPGGAQVGPGFPGSADVLQGGTLSLGESDGAITLLGGTAAFHGPPSQPGGYGLCTGSITGFGSFTNCQAFSINGGPTAKITASGGKLSSLGSLAASPGHYTIEGGAILELYNNNLFDCYFSGTDPLLIMTNPIASEEMATLHNFEPGNRVQLVGLPPGPPGNAQGIYITGMTIIPGSAPEIPALVLQLENRQPKSFLLEPIVPLNQLRLVPDGQGGTYITYEPPVE